MKKLTHMTFAALVVVSLGACDPGRNGMMATSAEHDATDEEYERGPHGGRLLKDGAFELELAIFATGVPPEFRIWARSGNVPVDPALLDVRVRLSRLGDRIDEIGFAPEGDFLRGDTTVYEPHSFAVSVEATFRNDTHRWEYDNFEGRTEIRSAIADALGLDVEVAGPAVLKDELEVYGHIEPDPERTRAVRARFEGVIESVHANLGERVSKGQRLITIESNESLRPYTITAPISGTVAARDANPGEQTAGRQLFRIIDTSRVWAQLAVFPVDRNRVRAGASVTILTSTREPLGAGVIDRFNVLAEPNQTVFARVVLKNSTGTLLPGMRIIARISVAEHAVPLAVRRTGLQTFRDFTVVYARVDDVYEVRMLELGRQDSEWAEVLGGLDPGTRYVSTNSYLVKADIEKSGASHDH